MFFFGYRTVAMQSSVYQNFLNSREEKLPVANSARIVLGNADILK